MSRAERGRERVRAGGSVCVCVCVSMGRQAALAPPTPDSPREPE